MERELVGVLLQKALLRCHRGTQSRGLVVVLDRPPELQRQQLLVRHAQQLVQLEHDVLVETAAQQLRLTQAALRQHSIDGAQRLRRGRRDLGHALGGQLRVTDERMAVGRQAYRHRGTQREVQPALVRSAGRLCEVRFDAPQHGHKSQRSDDGALDRVTRRVIDALLVDQQVCIQHARLGVGIAGEFGC